MEKWEKVIWNYRDYRAVHSHVKMVDFCGLTLLQDVRTFISLLIASQQGNTGAALIHV